VVFARSRVGCSIAGSRRSRGRWRKS
jgi:hypothetical protein